ncbi:MAG: enoyl-CoA hydratase/isomerase family protein [Candidatus Eisenbacteria bacterium]|nr:enoyl-CoA hydratase/isomerase family protein [Candidatus Eisenbacteria bacterium]
MAYENIVVEKKEGIATITISRPKVLNALNVATMDELRDAVLDIRQDDSIGVMIITGGGEKAFVAGADIREFLEFSPEAARRFAQSGQHVFRLIETMGKPSIAAVNGFALGGGCELAMSCTMRVASDSAKFGQPELNLGVIPGYGGTQRLTRIVGRAAALELILSGRFISAQEAAGMGLVNKVTQPENLMHTCQEMAKVFLSKGALAIRYAMEAVDQGLQGTIDEGCEVEANFFGLCFATEDMKEGVKAFLEKREAKFQGK